MNAALRKALAAAQLTETDVATHLGVDPKTVRRWLSGQLPYPRHRWALADLLQADADDLWTQNSREDEARTPASDHVQRVYAHRWQVPREVWWDLFNSAEQEIGILVYSGLFLADDAGMLDLLRTRARDGVHIRVLLGDPDSQSLQQRGDDEQIGAALASRACNALLLFQTALDIDGAEIRIHSTVLYNSLYITEKKILINQHIYGLSASRSPVIGIDFDASWDLPRLYASSFEAVWRDAKPVHK
ncbi:XRE family transcriptional regulator [Nocardiopsis tropica]|uniref:XRE family transcriptional regulator n=1 Tax=Nocardiopsis tropica TaxID=109330 RepID=A0ABV1ZN65_9ACTN